MKRPRAFKAVVLENDILRATFLPELGGRLWSLYHKPAGRELLHVNPVFQPANLAVRDAWFSGGVEWNLSIIGHCPLTCSPLFAARVLAGDGSPFLRLYEFERIRGVPFQIDVFLPDGSPFLFVRPRVTNPNDHAIPMYWWSNIAVDEVEGVRVLGPADNAYFHDYDGSIKGHGLPLRDGRDVTYPTRRASAADLYFRIPEDRRPWVTALDPGGRGLVHTSTRRLIGRKMFLWGTDPGGRRWQEHLAAPGHRYIEIQGGLARTQTEYVAMPAGARWEWLEAYGLIEADAATVHGADWARRLTRWRRSSKPPCRGPRRRSGLRDTGRMRIGRRPRRSRSARVGARWSGGGGRRPGWGRRRRRACRSRIRRWGRAGALAAVAGRRGDAANRSGPSPRGIHGAAGVAGVAGGSSQGGAGRHWLSFLHLGVMRYRAGDRDGAGEAWQRSLALEWSAWALRNLAVLWEGRGDAGRSVELWVAAARVKPELTPLAVEACEAMLRAGRYAEARELIDALPAGVAGKGRVRLIGATAALRSGDSAAAESLFAGGCGIANVREGELSLSDLWFEWQEARLRGRKPCRSTRRCGGGCGASARCRGSLTSGCTRARGWGCRERRERRERRRADPNDSGPGGTPEASGAFTGYDRGPAEKAPPANEGQ